MISLYPEMEDILTTLLMTPINALFCKILCLDTNVHSLLCVHINTIKTFVTYWKMCLFVFAKHGMDIYEQGLILDVFTGQFYETCQEYVYFA